MAFNRNTPAATNTASTAVAGVSNLPASNHSFACSTTNATTAVFKARTTISAHPVGASMLRNCLELSIMALLYSPSLLLDNRLGGRVLQEPSGAQQDLIEPDPFHPRLHAYGGLSARPEINERRRRLAPHPRPTLLRRPPRGQVTPRARPEDFPVCLVDRVRELHPQHVRQRLALGRAHLHVDPATVGDAALNLHLEDHV